MLSCGESSVQQPELEQRTQDVYLTKNAVTNRIKKRGRGSCIIPLKLHQITLKPPFLAKSITTIVTKETHPQTANCVRYSTLLQTTATTFIFKTLLSVFWINKFAFCACFCGQEDGLVTAFEICNMRFSSYTAFATMWYNSLHGWTLCTGRLRRRTNGKTALIQIAVNKQTAQSDRHTDTHTLNRLKQAASNTCRVTSGWIQMGVWATLGRFYSCKYLLLFLLLRNLLSVQTGVTGRNRVNVWSEHRKRVRGETLAFRGTHKLCFCSR